MQMSDNGKLLWDNKKFSKMYTSAEKLTGFFAEKLLAQAGVADYPSIEPLVVLDNACGTGVVTKALQDLMRARPADSFQVTCGDLADAMVDAITERIQVSGWTNTKAIKVDAQDTKLADEQFTHIFTNFGPMLFPNASAMLSECNRILKPRGICAFTTWKKVGWIDDVRSALESMTDLPEFPTDAKIAAAFSKGRWSDEDYVEEQLVEHGFGQIMVEAIPYTSVAANTTELRASLRPILAIVYRFWTDEEREKHANEETEGRIEDWFRKAYPEGAVAWHWVALVTTSRKPE